MKFTFILAALLASFSAPSANIVLTSKNSVSFNHQVDDIYVSKKMQEIMLKIQTLPATQPLYIVLDTPGGSVMAGNQFIDFVKSTKRPIYTITIFAASMGYQIAQELGKRYITNTGMLMSHRGAVSGLSGQVPGELNARLGMLQDLLEGMNVRAAKRVGMTVEAYQAAIINELWINGENAVKANHADEIASAVCDSSLSGTYSESVATLFGTVFLEFSNCPLISAPVGFSFGGRRIAANSRAAIAARSVLSASRKVNLIY